MDITELKAFLNTLTIAQLKTICNKPRNWGVYHTSPAISGYSKCKNKAELIERIYNYFEYFTHIKHGFEESTMNPIDGAVQDIIDFVYQDGVIERKVIETKHFPDFIYCDMCHNFHKRFGEHKFRKEEK